MLRRALAALGLFCIASPLWANVQVAGNFADNMLVQRDKEIAVWGTAAAGETVQVSLGASKAEAQADPHGKWSVKLPPLKAQTGLVLAVRGKNEISFRNVAVGEVWVCSGQSNMAWEVGNADVTKRDIPDANFPDIRFNDHRGWNVCTPDFVGGASAVAYYFARKIHRELNVPVGLIVRAQSMSSIQVWTPREAYSMFPELKAAYNAKGKAYLQEIRRWADEEERNLETSLPHALFVAHDGEMEQTSNWYEGNILPWAPFTIRGFLWYQGETNVADGMFYATRMKGLIQSWRKAFGDEALPFYFVQIAPADFDPQKGQILPICWMAQMACAKEVPHTEVAHTCDVGYSIHPHRKDLIGDRLARIALAKTYGQESLEYAGPRYKSHAIEGSKIRIAFEHAASGLISRDQKPLTFFEIAGGDGKFVHAQAEIDAGTVVVSSDQIAHPEQVRFAWSRDAVHNLSNQDGLPAYPFSTGQ